MDAFHDLLLRSQSTEISIMSSVSIDEWYLAAWPSTLKG